MGLFNNFPYLDLSNLNLDFILLETRHLKDYKEIAETSAATAEEAKNTAVQAAESAAEDAETASTSAESAQNYAEHIADPVGGLVTTWLDDNITPTTPPVDASLTIQGAAADAKATGDAIEELQAQVSNAMPVEVRQALDTIIQNLAFKNDDGYTDEVSIFHTWASSINIVSITAVYTQTGAVYETDSLNYLRGDLVVTALYDNGDSAQVSTYELSGELTPGTSTITVSFGGKSATFNVTVTANEPTWFIGTGVNQKAIDNVTYLEISTPETAVRAVYFMPHGRYDCMYKGNTGYESAEAMPYYAIPIPAGATGVKFTPPADVYASIYALVYDSNSLLKWIRTTTSGYINPNTQHTFTFASSDTHFAMACKHGSAGTDLVTQQDVNGIQIEFVYE